MPTFVQDQSQVALLYESGAFGSTSGAGQWIGYVQSHDISEDPGLKKSAVRFVGGATRNVNKFIDKGAEFTGTLSYYPQDWRMLKFALGKCADNGSPSPYSHTITEANNDNANGETGEVMPSFTIEDAQQVLIAGSGLNLVRTFKGCMVDTFSISIEEGEPISAEVGYSARTGEPYASGAITSITESTTVPFEWEHVTVAIPSGTNSILSSPKSIRVAVNNNLDVPNYANGSIFTDTPIPKNRDYEVTITTNADSAITKAIYDQYFKGGSIFNMEIVASIASAANEVIWTFSGCELSGFGDPTATEGPVEHALTIIPKTSSVVVNDTIEFYNNGSIAGTV